MTNNTIEKLTSGDDVVVLGSLFELSSSDCVPQVNAAIVTKLLRSSNSDIRERALFVFGIKARRTELCGDFVEILLKENPGDWDVISAAIGALYACGYRSTDGRLLKRLAYLLVDGESGSSIGGYIYSWLALLLGRISEEEFTRRSRLFVQASHAEVDGLLKDLGER